MNTTTIADDWAALETVLRELIRCQEALLGTAERTRVAIVGNDIDALQTLRQEEDALLRETETLELRRQAILGALVGSEQSADRVGLRDLAARAPEPWSGRLMEAREALLRAVTALGKRTEQNAALLRASLQHIGSFFRLLAEAGGGSRGYDRKGRPATAAAPLINRRA